MAKKKTVKAARRNDGWLNVVTGLGTSIDKRTASQAIYNIRAQEDWEQLYSSDDVASRIVDLIPEEGLRRWIEFTGVSKETGQDVNQVLQSLDARSAIEKTWKWARQTGGSVLYIVTDTDAPGEPLGKNERVIGLRDLSRYDLRILTTDIESDFGAPNYGCPNIYYLNVQMGSKFKAYPIHHTRVIRFDGKLVPRRTYIRNNYWHDSVLNRIYNAIRNYQTSNDAGAAILQDFNVGVYKMKNLTNLIAAGKEDVVKARLEMLNYSKSVIRSMVLDADEEDYVDTSRNVTGLGEMLGIQANRLVAATDIPHTKLLGESPDGSSATGNSTTSQWYDHIQSEQENYLRPKIKRLLEVCFPDMADLDFKFPKLWQLDELQEAQLRNQQSTTDTAYISAGVLHPDEVANSRFGGDTYSTETRLNAESRSLGDFLKPEDGEDVDTPVAEDESAGKEQAGTGAAPYVPNKSQEFKNKKVASKTKKQEAMISQTMSEPMRDPKYEIKMKPPGMPNKGRKIEPETNKE